MALLQQWRENHPMLGLGVAGLTAGIAGIGVFANSLLPWNWAVRGAISAPHIAEWEHPLRRRILETLAINPGLCYRRLQGRLDVANGTLRHHLDVLVSQRTLTIFPVNGRSCYYAGAPSQLEIIKHLGVEDSRAAELLPVGLSQVQREVVARLVRDPLPQSQASMSRDLGRSRASVNSAVQVLRRRGILASSRLDLASHLQGLKTGRLDYEWLDESPRAC